MRSHARYGGPGIRGNRDGLVTSWLSLALAQRILGHDAEARRWSTPAVYCPDHTHPAVFDEAGRLRADWLEARVLRREIEATVPDRNFPANLFAR